MIGFVLYPPHAGWAYVDLEGCGPTLRVTGSYITDCLRDLVDAIQSLATTSAAKCVWEQEPGRAAWHFRRTGDQIEVTVTYSDADDIDEEDIEFRHVDDWHRFGDRVLSEFNKVLQEMGPDSFETEWRYPFPFEACKKLENALNSR